MKKEYYCNKIVLRCLSEKDKKLIGIFVIDIANEYLHRCARLVYSALLAQNALISTVFSPLLASFATTSEAIRKDILDLPFGTSERGEREIFLCGGTLKRHFPRVENEPFKVRQKHHIFQHRNRAGIAQ